MNTLHDLKRNVINALDKLEQIISAKDDKTTEAFSAVSLLNIEAGKYIDALDKIEEESGEPETLKKELDWASYIVVVTACCCARLEDDIARYMEDMRSN